MINLLSPSLTSEGGGVTTDKIGRLVVSILLKVLGGWWKRLHLQKGLLQRRPDCSRPRPPPHAAENFGQIRVMPEAACQDAQAGKACPLPLASRLVFLGPTP